MCGQLSTGAALSFTSTEICLLKRFQVGFEVYNQKYHKTQISNAGAAQMTRRDEELGWGPRGAGSLMLR